MSRFLHEDAVRIGDWAEPFGKRTGSYSTEFKLHYSTSRRVSAKSIALLLAGAALIGLSSYTTGPSATAESTPVVQGSQLPAQVVAER